MSLSDKIQIAGFLLAIVVLAYTVIYNRRTVRIEWFKELILNPGNKEIDVFYEALYGLDVDLKGIDKKELADNDYKELKKKIDRIAFDLRKAFIDRVAVASPRISQEIRENIGNLTATIGEKLEREKLSDLKTPQVYRDKIESDILTSRRNLIKSVYNYRGVDGHMYLILRWVWYFLNRKLYYLY